VGVELEHWQVEIFGWVCTLLLLWPLLAFVLLLLLVLLLAAGSAAFVREEDRASELEGQLVQDLPFDLTSQQNPCPWVDRLGLVDLVAVAAFVAALGLELVGRLMELGQDLEQRLWG
jgi:hypothetical protein